MSATCTTTCRLFVADRSVHRHGLISSLRAAGFEPVAHHEPQKLNELGLLELDVLLEIDAPWELSDFFPELFALSAWRPLVCAQEDAEYLSIVLARKEGQKLTSADPSYQEVVSMLHSVARKSHAMGTETLPDAPFGGPLTPPPRPISKLSAALAHDLNNYLTIIRGNCQLLLNAPGAHEFSRHLLHEVLQAEEQAALLIRQLDSLSPADGEPDELQDLNEGIRESAGMLQSLLSGRHELNLDLSPGPLPVRMGAGNLQRILLNLAANSRDAMSDCGLLNIATVALEPGSLRPVACPSGPVALITVSDSGPGLAPEEKANLFKPKRSSKPGGKGLGLAIVHHLVQQLGGLIEAHSESGQGASFRIFLPLATAQDRCKRSGDSKERKVILLVEDESMVRSIFRRILQEKECFVMEAANGARAMCIAERFPQPIHLLITDVAMPGMSGIQLQEAFRSVHPETEVLLLSGYASGILPGQKDSLPPVAFLQKPFKAETLLEKVRQVLGSTL